MELNKIKAKVYTEKNGVFYVKVELPDLGIFINSFKVQESPKRPQDGLWVQEPKFCIKTKWVAPIEFDKSGQVWKTIENVCRKAVEDKVTPDGSTRDNIVADLDEIDKLLESIL
jgi:hypothetical protein